MEQDYVVFVHLLDTDTEEIATQHDAMPRGGTYPTSRWAGGEIVTDEVSLDTGEVVSGSYTLVVGLYEEGSTHDRLPAIGSPEIRISGDRVFLPTAIRTGPR